MHVRYLFGQPNNKNDNEIGYLKWAPTLVSSGEKRGLGHKPIKRKEGRNLMCVFGNETAQRT